jgi:hypothetical protein
MANVESSKSAILKDVFFAHVSAGRNLSLVQARALLSDDELVGVVTPERFETLVSEKGLQPEQVVASAIVLAPTKSATEIVAAILSFAGGLSAPQQQRYAARIMEAAADESSPAPASTVAEVLLDLRKKLTLTTPDFLKDVLVALRKGSGGGGTGSSPLGTRLRSAVHASVAVTSMVKSAQLTTAQTSSGAPAAAAAAGASGSMFNGLRANLRAPPLAVPPGGGISPSSSALPTPLASSPREANLSSLVRKASMHANPTNSVECGVQTDASAGASCTSNKPLSAHVGLQVSDTRKTHCVAAAVQTDPMASFLDQLALLERANDVEGRALDALRVRQLFTAQGIQFHNTQLAAVSSSSERRASPPHAQSRRHPLAVPVGTAADHPRGAARVAAACATAANDEGGGSATASISDLDYRVALSRQAEAVRRKQLALVKLRELEVEESRLVAEIDSFADRRQRHVALSTPLALSPFQPYHQTQAIHNAVAASTPFLDSNTTPAAAMRPARHRSTSWRTPSSAGGG